MTVRDLLIAISLTLLVSVGLASIDERLGPGPTPAMAALDTPTPRVSAAHPPPPHMTVAAAVVKGVETPVDVPLSMTDPDGQGLILERLNINSAVHGMLSFTELDMTFRNPVAKTMEGRFTAVLPEGAAISRFAKEVNGQLMEGEVVERLKANQVYQEILHQMRDPALLEQDQGNRFQARVFPIAAMGTVRLVLSWSKVLPVKDGVRRYVVPIRGLPLLADLQFHGIFQPLTSEEETINGGEIQVGGVKAVSREVHVVDFSEKNFSPKQDLEFVWKPSAGAPPARVLTRGDFYVAAFRPDLPATQGELKGPVSLWVDTSASGADGLTHHIRAVEQLLEGLPPSMSVDVWAFDVGTKRLLQGKAGELAGQIRPLLESRGYMGATDLGLVLEQMKGQALKAKAGTIFTLVGDGIPTLGKLERHDLLEVLAGWPQGVALHAVTPGNKSDAALLGALVEGRGRVLDIPFTDKLDQRAQQVAGLLRLPPGATLKVEDVGAEWIYPREFKDIQPGQEIITFGKVKAGSRPSPTAMGGKAPLTAPAVETLGDAFGPLLSREAYRAYLDHLDRRAGDEEEKAIRDAIRTEQIRVSTEQRILCPLTTLLVLETEQDYVRFNLDRRALSDILIVGPTGLGVLDRNVKEPTAILEPRPQPKPMPAPSRNKDEAKKAKEGPAATAAKSAMVMEQDKGGDLDNLMKSDDAQPAERLMADGAAADAESREESVVLQASGRASAPRREMSLGGLQGSGEGGGGMGYGSLGASSNAPGAPPPAAMVAPVAAPEAERDESVDRPSSSMALSPNRSNQVTAPKDVAMPPWVAQGLKMPTEGDLKGLATQVTDDPQNRSARNQYTDALLKAGQHKLLMAQARDWQPYDPENVQVYEVWGEALLALGQPDEAMRAFSSLADIAPSRPEVLGRAALLMWRANGSLAGESLLRRALELRPDLPNNHRNLGLLLDRAGRFDEAAAVLEAAAVKEFPNWYRSVNRVIIEELGWVYRDWMAADPSSREAVLKRARQHNVSLEVTEPLRITLSWDTDANDVDLHVVDPRGAESWYSNKSTSILELYEDVTQGFGPEVTVAHKKVAGTYSVGVNYFSAGPMGVSRGIVIVRQGGNLEVRPFRLVEGGADMRLLTQVTLK